MTDNLCNNCRHWQHDPARDDTKIGGDKRVRYGTCNDPDPLIRWDDETCEWYHCEHWEAR